MDQALKIFNLQTQYEEQELLLKKLKEMIEKEKMILQQQCKHQRKVVEKGPLVDKTCIVEMSYSIATIKYCSICKLKIR